MVVSISSKNNDHLQRNANNRLNSILCVPLAENNITGRKLSDEEIHNLAQTNSTNQQQSNQQLKFLFSKGKVIKKYIFLVNTSCFANITKRTIQERS